jgi:hypothetical protein
MTKKRELIDDSNTVVKAHGETLFERVSDYLTSHDWSFEVVEEGKYLTFGIRLRDAGARVLVDTAEDSAWSRILVYCTYMVFVPVHRRQAVAEALARINFVNSFGNLEMDLNDGEMRVRVILEGDALITEPMIDRAIRRGLELADQYQAALLGIAFGNVSPAEVLVMASRGEDAILQ